MGKDQSKCLKLLQAFWNSLELAVTIASLSTDSPLTAPTLLDLGKKREQAGRLH